MLHGGKILLLSHNRHGFANSLAISKNAHSRVKKNLSRAGTTHRTRTLV